jgi:hypothetical protein
VKESTEKFGRLIKSSMDCSSMLTSTLKLGFTSSG